MVKIDKERWRIDDGILAAIIERQIEISILI